MMAFWAAAALLLSAQQAWAATVLSTYVGVRGLLNLKLLLLELADADGIFCILQARPLADQSVTAWPLQQPETVPLSMGMRPNASFADLNDPAFTPVGYNGTTNVSQVRSCTLNIQLTWLLQICEQLAVKQRMLLCLEASARCEAGDAAAFGSH